VAAKSVSPPVLEQVYAEDVYLQIFFILISFLRNGILLKLGLIALEIAGFTQIHLQRPR
jgi:hypothetical protein